MQDTSIFSNLQLEAQRQITLFIGKKKRCIMYISSLSAFELGRRRF